MPETSTLAESTRAGGWQVLARVDFKRDVDRADLRQRQEEGRPQQQIRG